MTEETKDDGTVYAVFPGPNVGPEAAAGTLHNVLGELRPNEDGSPRTIAFVKRDAAQVEAAFNAGLLARGTAPVAPQAPVEPAVAPIPVPPAEPVAQTPPEAPADRSPLSKNLRAHRGQDKE